MYDSEGTKVKDVCLIKNEELHVVKQGHPDYKPGPCIIYTREMIEEYERNRDD